MKTSRFIVSLIIAAGAPSVALLAIAGLVPTDVALATLSVASLLAFAAFDYSWTPKSLQARATVIRPALPTARRAVPVTCVARRAA